MTREKWAKLLLQLYFMLALPILLMFGAARAAMTSAFLRFEYTRTGFPSDAYGFTGEDRLSYGSYGIEFLFSGDDVSTLAELRLPIEKCWQPPPEARDCPMFKARELQHMRDVKVIVSSAYALAVSLAGLVALLLAVGYQRPGMRQAMAQGVLIGSLATLALLAAAVTLVVAAWDRAFDAFHELFFAAGTWRFPYSDTLIRLYPEQLFVDAAIVIAALMGLGAVLLVALSLRFKGSLRQSMFMS